MIKKIMKKKLKEKLDKLAEANKKEVKEITDHIEYIDIISLLHGGKISDSSSIDDVIKEGAARNREKVEAENE